MRMREACVSERVCLGGSLWRRGIMVMSYG